MPAPSGFSIPSTPEWGEIKRRANSLNPMSEEEISDTLGRKINDTDRLILIRVDHAKINTVVGLIPAVRFFDDGERRDEAFR